jgi:hypothetical protein
MNFLAVSSTVTARGEHRENVRRSGNSTSDEGALQEAYRLERNMFRSLAFGAEDTRPRKAIDSSRFERTVENPSNQTKEKGSYRVEKFKTRQNGNIRSKGAVSETRRGDYLNGEGSNRIGYGCGKRLEVRLKGPVPGFPPRRTRANGFKRICLGIFLGCVRIERRNLD